MVAITAKSMKIPDGQRVAWRFSAGVLFCVAVLLAALDAGAVAMIRREVEPRVQAVLRGGTMLFVEVQPPRGDSAQALFGKYLANPEEWKQYKDRMAVAVPFARLGGAAQRRVLETLFPEDYVDEAGWWHKASGGGETPEALAEWLTGSPGNARALRETGGQAMMPRDRLLPAMKTLSPNRPKGGREAGMLEPLDPSGPRPAGNGVLRYGGDRQGKYAEYRMKKGESLYSSVVVRFTDFSMNAEVREACEIIQKRSGIRDARKIEPGDRILIPLEMLSDAYQPEGSELRAEYEAVRAEARQLESEQVASEDLDGVVVVLDPGHGGRDQGAAEARLCLYEDELNYDIMCRAKALLETTTRARVHVTMLDPDQGYEPSDCRRFTHDTDERVLTTPNYPNEDAKFSANLRWCLANSIRQKENGDGVDDRKMIFISIHCDSLYNESLRGTMIYVPGSAYRRGADMSLGPAYRAYAEARGASSACPDVQARRDEAISLLFARHLIAALNQSRPPVKVHDAGDPIRNVIRQSRGRAYLPAVLRNCCIPTKVLIETGNMTNPEDQRNLSDPKWRQDYAEAIVEALRRHFN